MPRPRETVDDPPDFARGGRQDLADFAHLNADVLAKREAKTRFELAQVVRQSVLLQRNVTKSKFASAGLLQLPFANELVVQAHADKVPHKHRRQRRAVLGREHVVLPSLQTLQTREG